MIAIIGFLLLVVSGAIALLAQTRGWYFTADVFDALTSAGFGLMMGGTFMLLWNAFP